MSLVPFANAWNADALDEAMREVVFDEIANPLHLSLYDVGFEVKATSDFRHAVEIQRRHGMDTWALADPALHRDMDEGNAFLLIAEGDGEPVACVGARLTWIEGGLPNAITRRKMLYGRPKRPALAGEQWSVSSDILAKIRNTHVCWFVSACKLPAADVIADTADPPVDHGFLFRGLMRLLNVCVYSRWFFSDVLGFADNWVTDHRAIQVEGFKRIEMGVTHHVPPAKRHYHVLHATRDDARRVFFDPRVADLSLPLIELQMSNQGDEPDDIAERFAGSQREEVA